MTTMTPTGDMLIGASAVRGSAGTQRAFNPSTNADIAEPSFGLGDAADVDRAATLAAAAFDTYRSLPLATRAAFLETIAENILALGDTLITRAHEESGLPIARLQGERGRTVGQLRLFAKVVRDGHFLKATIDPAHSTRQPLPRADLRLAKLPLGPVAVFGASNFPLAFSVAGGDTAAALAAGAPVIVKAHSAHLGTSELVGRALQQAVQAHDLPEGVFSLLIGADRQIGEALVAHPAIQAVGFTGSRQGGLALQTNPASRIPYVLTDKTDLVISTLSITPEREKVVDFSVPYSGIQVIVGAPRATPLARMDDLVGRKVTVVRGSTNDAELTKVAKPGTEVVRFDDDATAITAVLSGQAEFYCTAPALLAPVNQRRPELAMEPKLVVKTNLTGIGIRKNETRLKARVDDWVRENLRNGKLNAIYRKHHNADLSPDVARAAGA